MVDFLRMGREPLAAVLEMKRLVARLLAAWRRFGEQPEQRLPMQRERLW